MQRSGVFVVKAVDVGAVRDGRACHHDIAVGARLEERGLRAVLRGDGGAHVPSTSTRTTAWIANARDWSRGCFGSFHGLPKQGYFTVSGHLDEWSVEVGEIVEAGEVLGRVGETGSLRGPGLYFELRKGRDPQDPALWLSTG